MALDKQISCQSSISLVFIAKQPRLEVYQRLSAGVSGKILPLKRQEKGKEGNRVLLGDYQADTLKISWACMDAPTASASGEILIRLG